MGGRGNRGPRNISLGALRNLATHGLHSVNCRQYFGENYQHGSWQRLLPFFQLGGWITSTTAEIAKPCPHLNQSLLNSIDYGSRSTRDPNFVVNMCYMVLDRFPANNQRSCDLRSVLSLGQQAQHLDLPLSQVARLLRLERDAPQVAHTHY